MTPTPPTGYTLIWNDEFDTPSIDTTKWPVVSDASWSSPDNVKISNSNIVITVNSGKGGKIQSYKEKTKTGHQWTPPVYIECRAKLAGFTNNIKKTGIASGWWLKGRNFNQSTNTYDECLYEVDFEFGSSTPKSIHTSVACDSTRQDINPQCPIGTDTGACPPNHKRSWQHKENIFQSNLYDDFHTYAIHWTSQFISFIIDNTEVYKVTKGVRQKPLHLDLRACPKCWPEDKPEIILQQPAYAYFDYVRIYQPTIDPCISIKEQLEQTQQQLQQTQQQLQSIRTRIKELLE